MQRPIQLYSLATPNGQKVSVALEEMQLPYQAHTINILKDEQFQDWFVKINPNSKIPAITDPDGPNGEELSLMESGAILLYLADKTGQFISQDPKERQNVIQWLFFQMASVGPMFGQFGHFYKYAGDKCDHPYPVERYTNEVRRLLGVLNTELKEKNYICGDQYTIADMAIFPWVNCLDQFYEASEQLKLKEFKAVQAWLEKILKREAVQTGMNICSIPES